jgi:hypothetical protein
VGPTQLPVQWVLRFCTRGKATSSVKQPALEVNHSSPSGAEIRINRAISVLIALTGKRSFFVSFWWLICDIWGYHRSGYGFYCLTRHKRSVGCKKVTYVSEELATSFFRVEELSLFYETVVFNSTLKDFFLRLQIFLQKKTDILGIRRKFSQQYTEETRAC